MRKAFTNPNKYPFADLLVRDFTVENSDDEIKIEIFSSSVEPFCTIIAKYFIGIDYIGVWDEQIISDVKMIPDGDLVKKSKETIVKNQINPLPVYAEKKIEKVYTQLEIKFVDDSILKIAARSFEIEEHW